MPNPDRSGRIGPSDVAVLFGLSPYKSLYQLWHEKAGNIEPEDISDKDVVKFGSWVEPAIAAWFASENALVYHETNPITCNDMEGFGGKPDFYIERHMENSILHMGILEVKTTGWQSYKEWKDGEPPMHYQLQLQAYMGLAGLKWGMLAILVDRKLLPPFEYEFKPQAYQAIKKAVADFWQSIKDGKEPDPTDADKMQPFIRKLLTDEVVDLSGNNELASLVQKYRELEQQHQNARVKVLTLDQPKYHAFYDVQKYLADNKITAKRIKVGDAELITTITKEVPVKAFVRPSRQTFKIKYQHEGVYENE